MSPLHKLYQRFQALVHEAAKFGVIGVFNVFVNLGVQNLALYTVFTYQVNGQDHYQTGRAALTGTVVATLSSYLLNKYWAFRHREQSRAISRETVFFFVINCVGMALEVGCAEIFTSPYLLGMTGPLASNVGKLFGIVVGTGFRFWAYRQFVWTAKTELTPVEAALELEREGLVAAEGAAVPHQTRAADRPVQETVGSGSSLRAS